MHPVISLHTDNNVVIARTALLADTPVANGVVTSVRIPAGHKIAVRPIAQGELYAATIKLSALRPPISPLEPWERMGFAASRSNFNRRND
jgi:hypothetical protein